MDSDGEQKEEEGDEKVNPREVGHNIYILAHQVLKLFVCKQYLVFRLSSNFNSILKINRKCA